MKYNYLDITTEFGTIGNIYVNLDYLYGLSINDTLAAQDKKEKNNLILFDYIKSIMSGINTAIGNVANFDIFIDPIDSVARIIDVNYVDNRSRTDAYNNAFEIQIQNLKSVVRSYRFESQIFPEMSSVIAIGAQAQGGALAEDTNTLVDFNKNLVDRVIPKKDAPTSPIDPSVPTELQTKLNNLQQNWGNIAEYFIELNPDWWESKGDYDVEQSSKYANSTFKGKIAGFDAKKLSATKIAYDVEGDLTIHGISKKVKTKIYLSLNGNKVAASGNFLVHAQDYGIEIPSLVKEKFANQIKVSFNFDLDSK
jgi:hypothetical protein